MLQRTLYHRLSVLGAALAIMLGAGAPGSAMGQLTGNFYLISPLSTDDSSTALAISADGSVVTGQSTNTTTGTVTPFTWTVAGGTVGFNSTLTANSTNVTPSAVSNTSAGFYVAGTGLTNGSLAPFVYNGTTFTALSLNGADQGARATGVSDDGSVAVNGFGANVTAYTGYVYAPTDSGNYNITTLGGLGAISGIDEGGDAVPYLESSTNTSAIYHLFSGTKSVAPTLTGNYSYLSVTAISPTGRFVVGVASNNATAGQTLQRGYLYDSTNLSATLLSPFNPSDVYAVCRTVSDDPLNNPIGGGASGASSTFSNETGVLYDTALGVTLDLKQLLKDLYNVDVANITGNWTKLNEVHGISEDGKTIIGDGTTSEGKRTGFVVQLSDLPEDSPVVAFVAQPVSQTANITSNVTFIATAVPGLGGTDLTYHWFFNGTEIPNQTSNTLIVSNVTTGGIYYANATSSVSSNVSMNATLIVNGHLPTITTNATNATVKTGKSVLFVSHSKDSPTAYQWSFNGTALTSNATSANMTIANVTSANAGNYTVTVTTQYGNITSALYNLSVLYKPVVTTQPVGLTVTAGQPASLTVVATGDPAPTYLWYIHNRALTGASAKKATLNIPITHLPNSNIYRVRLINSQGTTYSDYANLTVLPINGNTSGNTSGNNSGNNTFGGNTSG